MIYNIFECIKLILTYLKYIIPLSIILLINNIIYESDIKKLIDRNDNKTSFVGNVLVSDEFSEEEVILIKEAASNWNIYTNGLVNLNIIREPFEEVDFTYNIILLKASDYDPNVMISDNMMKCKKCTYALTQRDFYVPNIKMFMKRIPNNDVFYTVILHEFGHYIGLDHLENLIDENALMFSNAKPIRKEITKNDLKYFCDVYQCSPEKRSEILNDKRLIKLYIK